MTDLLLKRAAGASCARAVTYKLSHSSQEEDCLRSHSGIASDLRSDGQVPVDERLRTRKAEGQNQLRPSTRAVEGFAGVWVTIRACGEVGFRLTAEAEIGRGRFADGPSAVLSIEFQHAVGGGCAVRDLGFRFFAHVLPSSSGRPPARSRNVVLGWW
jgi:hypothetical protein